MNDNAKRWLDFADENLACAYIIVDREFYNAALQNAQQATEKALKAMIRIITNKILY